MIISEEETPDVPRNRIMIGGFSQGGAVAITTLTREPKNVPLAGCLALSTYFPGNKPVSDDKETKILRDIVWRNMSAFALSPDDMIWQLSDCRFPQYICQCKPQ